MAMPEKPLHVVTGGLGFTGRHIAASLVASGVRVRTLTNSPHRPNPFGAALEVRPLPFANPSRLAASLRGAAVLYNTYWVRFNHRGFDHATAVANTLRLFEAAAAAGVRRVVHLSITNPDEGSHLEYFRGKARLERALRSSGLSWAILRPAVIFGDEGILINNIAWFLRRFPVFGVFGDAGARIRPIHVRDLAALAVEAGGCGGELLLDAVGPERYSYRDLVRVIGAAIGRPRPLVSLPPAVAYWTGRAVGTLVGDVVVTREEIDGLMAGLLDVDGEPRGTTSLSSWCRRHRTTLGARWAGELGRRTRCLPSRES